MGGFNFDIDLNKDLRQQEILYEIESRIGEDFWFTGFFFFN